MNDSRGSSSPPPGPSQATQQFITTTDLLLSMGDIEWTMRWPGHQWRLSERGIDGAVMVNSSAGILVLCHVEEWRKGACSGIRAVPVKVNELERLP